MTSRKTPVQNVVDMVKKLNLQNASPLYAQYVVDRTAQLACE